MLKGSIKTRDNILRKFKNLKVTVNNEKIRIDKDFIEMTVEEDAGKANYTTDKNYYKYMAEDIVDITKDSIQPGESVIINFRICLFGMKPFIQYEVVNKDGKLDFNSIVIKNQGEIPTEYQELEYYGKVDIGDKQILMFESKCISNKVTEITKISRSDKSFWLSVHEVMNSKHNFGLPVSDNISKILSAREELLYLQDEDEIIIEIPMVGYRGEYYKKMAFIAGLGMPRSGPYSSLGPYYNFANFKRSLRYACVTLDGKPKKVFDELITRGDTPVFTKGGMVKFILFLGRTKVMLNKETDKKDDTDESLSLAAKRPFFKQLLRLRDSSGKWATEYDSVIQPFMEVYDPELKRTRPLDPQYTVKTYTQQTALQYAYFNTDNIDLDKETGFYDVEKSFLM